MNAFAVFMVNEYLDELRDEAARHRATHPSRPSTARRIAAAASRMRGVFSTSVDEPAAVLPKLDGYPYRG